MPVSFCRKVLEMGPSHLFGPMAAFILIALSPAVLGTGVSEVDSLLGEGRPILVYIHQDWCHFCAEQEPIIDQIEEELISEIAILRVDAGQNPEIAAALGVSAYPTTFIITGSDETDCIRLRFTGLTDDQTLRQYLNEAIDGTLLPDSCCGNLGSPAGNDCEALKQACDERCNEICEKALNVSWRLDVFCCSQGVCNAYNPYGPSRLEFCNVPGYVGCVTPLIEEYHACLEQCIDRYVAANSSERVQLRANCRTECNEEFYSKLYAQC